MKSPATHTRTGSIPITIATFLYDDIRQVIGTENRLDIAANNMLEEDIKKYHPYWIEILYSIFLNFCGCSSSRTRNVSAKRNAVISCIYGTLDHEDDAQSGINHIAHRSAVTNFTTNPNVSSSMDLPKSLQAMINIIPIGERLDGDETKPFTDRLEPILNQMKAASISEQHQPVVMFSLTTGKARDAVKKVNINNTTVDALVDHIKEVCLYDKDIQERRGTRWKEIKYTDFRSRHDTEDAATRKCIHHVTSYHKDLPKHLTSDASMLDRVRQIFANEPWCATLYERSSGHQTALMFSQALITAAPNADNRKRVTGSGTNNNHVHHTQQLISQGAASGSYDASLIAFFAKTPPPHRSRRPTRYRYGSPFHRSRYGQGRSYYQRNRFPQIPGRSSNRRC